MEQGSVDQPFVFLQSKDSSIYYERDLLPTHSARKFVMDFLRVIVVDSFSLAPSPKQAPVIDLLLEVIMIVYFIKEQKWPFVGDKVLPPKKNRFCIFNSINDFVVTKLILLEH